MLDTTSSDQDLRSLAVIALLIAGTCVIYWRFIIRLAIIAVIASLILGAAIIIHYMSAVTK